MPARKKRPAMPGAGRPHRAQGQPTTTLGLRLTEAERGRLRALGSLWECSEPDAARRAIEMAADMCLETK